MLLFPRMNYINKLESDNEKLSALLKEAEGRLGEALNLAKNSGADRQPLAKELVEQLEPLKNRLDNIAKQEAAERAREQALASAPKRKVGRPRKNPDAPIKPTAAIMAKHTELPSASNQDNVELAMKLAEVFKLILK